MSSKGPSFNLFKYFATERMLKNPKGSLSDFFGTVRLKNSNFFVFSKIFQRLQMFPFNFLKFCSRMLVKKTQRARFYSVRHCEKFQNE